MILIEIFIAARAAHWALKATYYTKVMKISGP